MGLEGSISVCLGLRGLGLSFGPKAALGVQVSRGSGVLGFGTWGLGAEVPSKTLLFRTLQGYCTGPIRA